jgi:hypothetical protein
MLGVTIFGLFLTPSFYVVLRGISLKFWKRGGDVRPVVHHQEKHEPELIREEVLV